ncbi:MAG: type II toxin-antitoxin system VapC family toxin [Pyrobaculum sp.]
MGGRYVFDTSAIIKLVELRPRESIELLRDQITADLALYEIGNYIWKLYRRNIVSDLNIHINFFTRLLSTMVVEDVGLREEVIELAVKSGVTYYDAVYLWLSLKHDVPLVTEDDKLCKAALSCIKTAQL